MRRAVDTFITLCDKQKIGIDFDDYQLFEIIQGNMSIGAVPPDKKTLSHHKRYLNKIKWTIKSGGR